jgi:hypothetical protein
MQRQTPSTSGRPTPREQRSQQIRGDAAATQPAARRPQVADQLFEPLATRQQRSAAHTAYTPQAGALLACHPRLQLFATVLSLQGKGANGRELEGIRAAQHPRDIR